MDFGDATQPCRYIPFRLRLGERRQSALAPLAELGNGGVRTFRMSYYFEEIPSRNHGGRRRLVR